MNWQATTMAQATVRAQVHQALDIHGNGSAQVALDHELGYFTAKLLDLGIRQVLDLGGTRNTSGVTDAL